MIEEQQASPLETAGGREGWRSVRHYLNELAKHSGEWAGIPMPIEGLNLTIHPKYKYASVFKPDPQEPEPDDGTPRYDVITMIDRGERRHIILHNRATQKREMMTVQAHRRIVLIVSTLGCENAWEIEAEGKAVQKLAGMVSHRQFRQYMLTGQLFERSQRSMIAYIFRRLRPTIVLSAFSDKVTPICTLCMHPIGYYEDTFGGAMVPTDDVIAHLTLMRGDEHEFWKQANQHPPDAPQSAI